MALSKQKLDADVIVVGGSIVGGTFACLLARAGFRVILLNADERQTLTAIQADVRTLAVSVASAQILKRAGAWQRLPRDKVAEFTKMYVWDENSDGEVYFNSASICQARMGYIIPQREIVAALQAQLHDMENVRCLWSVSPTRLEVRDKTAWVVTEEGLRFSARLLVAADGSHSGVRRLAGIYHQRHDYKQSALACVVTTEYPHEKVARQRFLEYGPLAFLPMVSPHQSAIVWSGRPGDIRRLQKIDETAFHDELAEAFNHKLGAVSRSGERFVFPLSRMQAECYCKPRIALIGDSAHTVHPLAGLGANLGLLDAAVLVETITDCHRCGRDFGLMQVLRRYERCRKFENRTVMYLLDGIKYLFEDNRHPLRGLRSIGLDMFDGLPLLKPIIMKRAMGLEGDLPQMARHGR